MRLQIKTGLLFVVFSVVSCIDATAEEITLDTVVDFLRQRESKFSQFQADVAMREMAGKDYNEYWEAAADYDMYISHHIGNPQPRSEPVNKTHNRVAKPEYMRLTMDSRDAVKLEAVDRPFGDEEALTIFEQCFDGINWQVFYPHELKGATVYISNEPRDLRALSAFGMLLPNPLFDSKYLSDLLIEHQATASSSENGTVKVAFRIPEAEGRIDNYIEVELSPGKQFAPLSCMMKWVPAIAEQPAFPSRGFRANWRDWSTTPDGLHIAQKLEVTRWAEQFLPTDRKKGFQKIVVNGSPKVFEDYPLIDPSSYNVLRYDHATEEYDVTNILTSVELSSPLCRTDFPEGTYVQDERGETEVFVLTGTAPAVGNELRNQLEPLLREEPPVGERSFIRTILITSNLILLVVVVTIVLAKRKRGRA